jgi:alkylhydroperoxidase/carboxymuconolactone decarboxylase family protein YurZ
MPDNDWNFPFEGPLHATFPALHDAQSSFMAQLDSLKDPDRKTHELVRLACTVGIRNPSGVYRHARFAAEIGASWEEILGSIMLTIPAFGILPAVEAIPTARKGFERALETEFEEIEDEDVE